MKFIFPFLILISIPFISSAQVEVLKGYEIEKSISNLPGTIRLFGDSYLIDVNIPEQNIYYTLLPVNLKKEFEVDGMKIVFGGIMGKVPIYARMIGTPFHITSIRKYVKPKPKAKTAPVKK